MSHSPEIEALLGGTPSNEKQSQLAKRGPGRPPGPITPKPDPKIKDRLVAEQARLAGLRADKLASILVPADDVRTRWETILGDVRAGLLAIPARLRASRPNMAVDDLEAIDREIRTALALLGGAAEGDSATLVAPEPGNGAGRGPGAAKPRSKADRRGSK